LFNKRSKITAEYKFFRNAVLREKVLLLLAVNDGWNHRGQLLWTNELSYCQVIL